MTKIEWPEMVNAKDHKQAIDCLERFYQWGRGVVLPVAERDRINDLLLLAHEVLFNARGGVSDEDRRGALTQPVVRLQCCSCGSMTRGRQWWNRDTRYGCCVTCVQKLREEKRASEYEIYRLYGIEGVNWGIEEAVS